MIDKPSVVDRTHDRTAATRPSAHRVPSRRRWTEVLKHFWPAMVGLLVGALAVIEPTAGGGFTFGLEAGLSLSVATLLIAAVYLPIGAIRRQLGGPGVLTFETAGVLTFGALALAALLVEQHVAQYLLAAAFLGHAAWDFAHHRADMVVPKGYAEFCIVLDVILAVGLLVVA